MDPNYKSFLAWKKSNRSREFMEKKDIEDLQNIRQQSKKKFTQLIQKAFTPHIILILQ
jgi:hypothetical protein